MCAVIGIIRIAKKGVINVAKANGNGLQKRFDDLVKKIKKENPNANWKNLAAGVLLLVMVGIFSVWYFSTNPSGAPSLDVSNDSDVSMEVEESLNANSGEEASEGESGSEESKEGTLTPEEQVSAGVTPEGMVEVQADEGLWQVATRVCGNGESYVYLADANGLNIWWAPLTPGQMLKVDCGTK